MLEQSASLSEFEDHMRYNSSWRAIFLCYRLFFCTEYCIFRCSEDIRAILPSEQDMKAEVIVARLWMDKCQAYLRPRCDKLGLGVFLKVDDLKVCSVWLS